MPKEEGGDVFLTKEEQNSLVTKDLKLKYEKLKYEWRHL